MPLQLITMETLNMPSITSDIQVQIIHGLESTNITTFNSEVRKLTTQGNAITPTDKVYFSPWSDVPRYKFGEYAKDKPKLSRVINPAKATAIVLEPNRIVPSIVSSGYNRPYFKIPKTVIQPLVAKLRGKTYEELDDYVYVHDLHWTRYMSALLPGIMAKEVQIHTFYSSTDLGLISEKIDAANEILASNKKLISDMAVLEEINQGIMLDAESYQQISNMFASSDRQNIGLAMDIMANANYQQSEFRIALLLNRFRNQITGHKNMGLVNFRSLLSYFSKYNWRAGDVDFAGTIVLNANPAQADFQERMDIVSETLLAYVNHLLDVGHGIFTVDKVNINPPNLSKHVQAQEQEVGELEED